MAYPRPATSGLSQSEMESETYQASATRITILPDPVRTIVLVSVDTGMPVVPIATATHDEPQSERFSFAVESYRWLTVGG